MSEQPLGPSELIARCAASHSRLESDLEALDDGIAGRPTSLPLWSVGHLLTHLARNADSHQWLAEGIAAGEVRDQYPGGTRGRNADIDAGGSRSARELVSDLTASNRACEGAWARLDDTHWAEGEARALAGTWRATELPFYRQREVEIHRIDLGLGATWEELDAAYVEAELRWQVTGLASRTGAQSVRLAATDLDLELVAEGGGAGDRIDVAAPGWRLVAWLFTRIEAPDLPTIGAWP